MFTRNKVLFFTEMGNVDEKWGILSYLVDWAFFGLLGLGGGWGSGICLQSIIIMYANEIFTG